MTIDRLSSGSGEDGRRSNVRLKVEFPEGCISARNAAAERETRYSICTCVTDLSQYREMVASFWAAGFVGSGIEFLYVDNTEGNSLDAFAAYNLFLRAARGRYVILCHQDIVLRDDCAKLDRLIAETEEYDRDWGLLGNAGGINFASLSIRLPARWGGAQRIGGPFPTRVWSLDENFIIARASANLALSRDLSGYHLYGADICMVADILGYHSYVIDFHVWHKGNGFQDISFYMLRREIIQKYRRALRTRAVATTCTQVVLSGSRVWSSVGNTSLVRQLIRFILRMYRRVRKVVQSVSASSSRGS
jgi:hypothetical protein